MMMKLECGLAKLPDEDLNMNSLHELTATIQFDKYIMIAHRDDYNFSSVFSFLTCK